MALSHQQAIESIQQTWSAAQLAVSASKTHAAVLHELVLTACERVTLAFLLENVGPTVSSSCCLVLLGFVLLCSQQDQLFSQRHQ